MQLKTHILIGFSCLLFIETHAQDMPTASHKVGDVQIDILSSYYEQDGEHGAVLGGVGSQKLTDKTLSFQVNVPIDTVNVVDINLNVDTYTSASSDQIDMQVSGPSGHDTRKYGNISFTRMLKKGNTISIGTGFSSEFDVKSGSANLGFSHSSSDRNTEIGVHSKLYYDSWKLIYPTELRYYKSSFNLPDHRLTLSGDFTVSQVIGPKMQALLSYELISQNGLLSTPFHRVYYPRKWLKPCNLLQVL